MNTLIITVLVMVYGLFLYLRLYKRMNLENEQLRTELAELRMEVLPVAQELRVLQTKFDGLREMLNHVFQWIKDHDAEPLDPALAVQWAREARKRQREIEEALGG